MNSTSKFKTLIFIDLETTGLPYDDPKITELAMLAVNVATLEEMKPTEELPRVLNKFVKFFNPIKSLRNEVVDLTGLTNRVLINYAPFNRETVLGLEAFLSDFQKPMCFIAHNGNLFDFPVLFSEIKSALSNPSLYANLATNNNANTDDACICDIEEAISSDNTIINGSPTKQCSVQTIPTHDDSSKNSLLSISCADSLVFFREMQRLLNDKDLVQYPMEITVAESNQNKRLQMDTTVDSSQITSSTVPPNEDNDNNNSNTNVSPSRVGYIEIRPKYTPSQDPARQLISMKLSKIYEREFDGKTTHLKSHQAEDDCLMLLAIVKRYLPDWLEWIELNHQPLSNFSSLPIASIKTTSPNSNINRKRPLKF